MGTPVRREAAPEKLAAECTAGIRPIAGLYCSCNKQGLRQVALISTSSLPKKYGLQITSHDAAAVAITWHTDTITCRKQKALSRRHKY
jgi:hypothetical protein